MKVAVGIEPTNKSFADSGLTTWLRHQNSVRLESAPTKNYQYRKRETRFELATSTLARWSSTTELLPHHFSLSMNSLTHFQANVKLIFD